MLDLFTNIQSAISPHNGILIVGDGNFSFSKDVACFAPSVKLHATSFDSKETIYANEYARSNVEFLYSQSNVDVKHDVDATNLSRHFPDHRFALIIFNFPHVGGKSNIKKCRLLLEKFFASSVCHLCHQGKVLVSLCKGQGGTPRDISRGAYGNSWKISTQAAKAGLVLINVEPFDASSLANYRQAGYRSCIKNGFFTNGALLHVFVQRSQINLAESHLDKYRFRNIFIEKMEQICSTTVDKVFENLGIEVQSVLSEMNDFSVKTSKCVKQITCRSNTYAKIAPTSHHVSFEVMYFINLTMCKLNLEDFKEVLLTHLRQTLLANFFIKLKENSCFLHVPCPCKSAFLHNEMAIPCDPDFVPDFVDEIPKTFWICEPEITISFTDCIKHEVFSETVNESVISYKKVPARDYKKTEVEERYLKKKHDCVRNAVFTCFHVNGFCIASLISNGETLEVNLHIMELFFACYEIKNYKYLWSEDEIFKQQLLLHMISDDELQKLTSPSFLRGSIQYPLCYRHDLCFWLDEQHSEDQLLSIILSETHGCLHGMVLLRLLCYKESDLVSYCYRMIYSRVDGPLTHLESVQIQNNVRLRLLGAGFKLR